MLDEITATVLVAANDHDADKRMTFGIILDLPAAVVVHASAPRGSGHFEFAARMSSADDTRDATYSQFKQLMPLERSTLKLAVRTKLGIRFPSR
jgi:hypothetical protein